MNLTHREINPASLESFHHSGFQIIRLNQEILTRIESIVATSLQDMIGEIPSLEKLHESVGASSLNELRMRVIKDLSSYSGIHELIWELSNGWLPKLMGENDISVQKTINTSIQLPLDPSSILPLHSDVLAGNSSYEVIMWFPFMDVAKTSSFYILPLERSLKYYQEGVFQSREEIFEKESEFLFWPELKKGEGILFSTGLLHGNVVNQNISTRVSCNVRFKSTFSPYNKKRPSDYFTLLRRSALSVIGEKFHDAWEK